MSTEDGMCCVVGTCITSLKPLHGPMRLLLITSVCRRGNQGSQKGGHMTVKWQCWVHPLCLTYGWSSPAPEHFRLLSSSASSCMCPRARGDWGRSTQKSTPQGVQAISSSVSLRAVRVIAPGLVSQGHQIASLGCRLPGFHVGTCSQGFHSCERRSSLCRGYAKAPCAR